VKVGDAVALKHADLFEFALLEAEVVEERPAFAE
jgi:hypothetical protein